MRGGSCLGLPKTTQHHSISALQKDGLLENCAASVASILLIFGSTGYRFVGVEEAPLGSIP